MLLTADGTPFLVPGFSCAYLPAHERIIQNSRQKKLKLPDTEIETMKNFQDGGFRKSV
jgi:hypothetical protein